MLKKFGEALIIIFLLFVLTGCISFGEKNDYGGVFKSADKGANFQQKVIVASPGPTSLSIGNENILTLEIDPQDHNAIYAGTLENGLFYSYDGAGLWQKAKSLTGEISTIAISPIDKCDIYAGSGNNIFLSQDCNRTYVVIYTDPRSTLKITKLVISKKNPSVIFAGTSQGDLLKSNDNGKSWMNIKDFKMAISDMIVDKNDDNLIFVATKGDFYKTADGGKNWEDLSENFKNISAQEGRFSLKKIISIDGKSGNSIMALSDKNILSSFDGGKSWNILKLVTPPGKVNLYSFAVNLQNPNEIYYTTETSLVRSNDGGNRWISAKLPSSRAVLSLVIDPVTPNILYMGMYKLKR